MKSRRPILEMAVLAALGYGPICRRAYAYTVIELAPGVPESVEQSLIASTTNQYNATVTPNVFFPNTFNLKVYGLNPSYNPPPTNANLLNALATVDSYTYVAGWANGESYQQYADTNLASFYAVNCSSPSLFNLVQKTSATFDLGTCEDVLGTLIGAIFSQHLSTPTVVPGNFQ